MWYYGSEVQLQKDVYDEADFLPQHVVPPGRVSAAGALPYVSGKRVGLPGVYRFKNLMSCCC